jgi:uncharacterized protein (TIGR04255 family)
MGAADEHLRLPSFRKPPLEEVALAVQFQPNAIDLLRAARIADAVRDRLPRREEQPGRPPMAEDFGPQPQEPPFQIEVLPGAPMPRLWFLSEDGSRLLQVQADLIAYNWRRAPEEVATPEPYPRYSRLRVDLVEYLEEVDAVVTSDGEILTPNWCEVTYINHITAASEGTQRPRLQELLRGVEDLPDSEFLPAPEDAQVGIRYLIPGDEGPRGRLTVSVFPGVRRTDLAQIWVMTLTARVLAAEGTRDGAMDALDLGHEWVVRGFNDLTSEKMHTLWEEEVSNAAAR